MFQSLESVDLKQRTGNQCTLSIDFTESYRPLKNHALVINSKSKDWFAQDTIPLRGIPYMGLYKEHEYFIYHYIYLAVVSILALFAALKLVLSVILLYSLSLIKFAKPKAPGQELFFRTVQLEPSVADMQCCPNIALALRSYGSELF